MRPRPSPNLQRIPRVQIIPYILAVQFMHIVEFVPLSDSALFNVQIFVKDEPQTKDNICSRLFQMMKVIQMQRRSKRKR